MLDANAILEFCNEKGFRISAKAYLLLQEWCDDAGVSGEEVAEVLKLIAERAGEQEKTVFRVDDMKALLEHWNAPLHPTGHRIPINQHSMKESAMETDYCSENEYLGEIERLKQIIQIIINKHSK